MEQWLALIDTALAMHQRHGCALVVIDSLAYFLPAHSENSASALLECLTPLQRLTAAGMSVLLPHHPRKGRTLAGQAARGSGALPGFVDVLIEMAYYAQPDDLDRRRQHGPSTQLTAA
jgi:RecA-family ATPase